MTRVVRSNRARGVAFQHFTGAPTFASRLMDQHYSPDVRAHNLSLESGPSIDVCFDLERLAACEDEECGLTCATCTIHTVRQLQKPSFLAQPLPNLVSRQRRRS